ncbi:MAG: hypothetical protein ABSF70_01700 [Terracidiphilus sp.]|jgi:hypothetical protein
MKLSTIDWALWVSGFLGHLALFCILMIRRRWRSFPIFTTYMGFEVAWTMVLYAIYQGGSRIWYARIYWWGALFDFLLQSAVIFEIARIVMRPTGTWVRDAKKQFILWGGAGILLAAALPWLVAPPAASMLGRLEVRGDLFTSLVICELIAVVTRTSKTLGLGWRNHVMALGNAWTAWAVLSILVDGLRSYFGATRYFGELDHIQMIASQTVVVYWMVQFWQEEPARQPISPELRSYIEALHQRIKKDLDILEAQR